MDHLRGEAPLTGRDVANVAFAPTRFRAGYDADEVDAFLDVCIAALQGDGTMTAGAVRAHLFTTTRFRDGYAMHEVDATLERIARTLEGGGRA